MSQRLRHLTSLENMPSATIERLLDRAVSMRNACAHGTRKLDLLAGRTVLNLFFEPSTRTRTSFELAARRLGADGINFDIGLSSTSKGEALFDTLHTLEAMHLDTIVVRHKVSGTPEELVRHAMSGVSVVNAGDGNRAHPTQGLLDVLTIRQHDAGGYLVERLANAGVLGGDRALGVDLRTQLALHLIERRQDLSGFVIAVLTNLVVVLAGGDVAKHINCV